MQRNPPPPLHCARTNQNRLEVFMKHIIKFGECYMHKFILNWTWNHEQNNTKCVKFIHHHKNDYMLKVVAATFDKASWIRQYIQILMNIPVTAYQCKGSNLGLFTNGVFPWSVPSWNYKQWKSDLDASSKCFMYDNSELSCWKFYDGSQWVFMIFPLSEIGGSFGVHNDWRIDPNSIPYPDVCIWQWSWTRNT